MFRMGQEEVDEVTKVLLSKSLFRIDGVYQEVNSFEKELREHMGVEHCLCLTSGTGALTAALVALGVGPGDEVIIPGYTFIATAMAVLSAGGIPVLAEVDETLTLDTRDVEAKLTPNTKAVIPVHIQGFPCDMEPLMKMSRERGFFVVEDACQADGGSYKGKRLGTIGDCGAYSFNYFKIISAGEGGALVTHDEDVYERAVIYHDCGTAFWTYEQPIKAPLFSGTNMRVSEVTGAILRVQLKRLDGILADLRRVKREIMAGVKDLPGIRFNRSNDLEGDCGVCIPFFFGDPERAQAFAERIGGHRPINTGKHVYSAWTPILERRGACVKGMNPYYNPENAGLRMEVKEDSCPKTLDFLSRTVYMTINCDWDGAAVNEAIERVRAAARHL